MSDRITKGGYSRTEQGIGARKMYEWSEVAMFLYRGVNQEMYKKLDGKLCPKNPGAKFSNTPQFGDPGLQYGPDVSYGESIKNELHRHQADIDILTTSGISTTTSFDVAISYATNRGRYSSGYIYKIAKYLLSQYDVSCYPVPEMLQNPKKQEDQEYVLVAKDYRCLPSEIVIELIEYTSEEL